MFTMLGRRVSEGPSGTQASCTVSTGTCLEGLDVVASNICHRDADSSVLVPHGLKLVDASSEAALAQCQREGQGTDGSAG